MRQLITICFLLVAIPYLLQQFRKPGRVGGRIIIWLMNLRHSAMIDWGLSQVKVEPTFTILDVGCGGGRTLTLLAARASSGKVQGIDYADGSVAESRRRNRGLIAAGRVEVHQAAVSRLPFPDHHFDLAIAVETHYYWPDLVNDLREIRRVLRPSGALLIVAEGHKGGRFDVVTNLGMRALRATHLTREQLRAVLSEAGYQDIEISPHLNGRWISVLGRAA
jgi:SAM-dependent methyltransferase